MTHKLHFDDITKITCPFGLLDGDTQERLKMCDDIQYYGFDGKWRKTEPKWYLGSIYRKSPPPPEPVSLFLIWNKDDFFMSVAHDYSIAIRTQKSTGGNIYQVDVDGDGTNPTIQLLE